MLLRSLCAHLVSVLVLCSSLTAGSLLAQERPPFVDELPSQFAPAQTDFRQATSFRSVLDPPPRFTPSDLLPVVAEDAASSSPDTTTYASVEIPAPGPAYDDDVNTTMNSVILDRLMAVEAELSTLRNESLVKKVEEEARKPVYKLGGRIHLDQWFFTDTSEGIGFFEHPDPANANFGADPEDRTFFRRVRLELSGENPADMIWRFQVDFNGTDIVEFKDVYVGWKGLPANQRVLLGNQKRPIGLDHWNSSRFNVFIERPLAVEANNEDARRVGGAIWGHTDEEDLFWQYGVYHIENINANGGIVGDSLQPSLNGRFGGSPWYEDDAHWAHWAAAGQTVWPDGDPSDGSSNSNEGRFRTRPEARSDSRWFDTGRIAGGSHAGTVALEGMYNYGPLNLTGEFFYSHFDRTASFGDALDFHGGYVQAAWFLGDAYMTYKRSVGSLGRPVIGTPFSPWDDCSPSWGVFQLALRYSYLDITSQDILGGDGDNITFGTNWRFSPYAQIQFNVIYGQIRDHAPVGGFTSGDYTMIGTRYAIDF